VIALVALSAWAADPPEEAPITAMPTIVEYVEAPYPPEAEAGHLEGKVGLLLELDETGALVKADVIRPAGHGFDEAALDAVRKMKFSPALTAEGPVPVVFEFDYGFVLKVEAPPPEPAAPPPVTLEGTLREMGTRKPVAGARLAVQGTDLLATSDADGRFEIRGVPPGHYTLRVLEPGHVTLDQPVDVAEGEITSANLWLRAETYRENESVGYYRKDQQEVTRRTITMQEVRRVPGTFGDPVRVVQTLPGAARPPFGTGLLVIRGSNPEDSGVYIDGIRIPLIYHLTGTTSVLAPDLI
jgi:TonB family protein